MEVYIYIYIHIYTKRHHPSPPPPLLRLRCTIEKVPQVFVSYDTPLTGSPSEDWGPPPKFNLVPSTPPSYGIDARLRYMGPLQRGNFAGVEVL